jgi:hypothetical protein
MARIIKEWIGKNDNEAIPPRVKLRVFLRAEKHCAACTLLIVGKLRPEYDHVVALINGGQHRESNLQLLCSECHKAKTKLDVAEKSESYRKQLNAAGIRSPSRLKGQGFRKAKPPCTASRPLARKSDRYRAESDLDRDLSSVSEAMCGQLNSIETVGI